MFAGDFDPGDVVTEFDRQVELRVGLPLVRLESKVGFAERQTLQVKAAQ